MLRVGTDHWKPETRPAELTARYSKPAAEYSKPAAGNK